MSRNPTHTRPRPVSSFCVRKPWQARYKLAVVQSPGISDRQTWDVIMRAVGDQTDAVILSDHPMSAAARWGYWHWTVVRVYGSDEDDLFMQEADRVLLIGPKTDELLTYYRDLAKYHDRPVTWAVPKKDV